MTAMAEMKPFFDAVLKHIPRATDREKAEIRQELLDHLNDHIDALAERGVSGDEAVSRALEAMGDPAEIGTAWNRQLSPFWLGVEYLCKFLVADLMILFIISGLFYAVDFAQGIGVRMTGTLESEGHFDDTYQLIQRQELDIEQDMGRHILRLYRLDLGHGQDGYQATAYFLTYPEQPFHPPLDIGGLAFDATTCNGQKSFHMSCEGVSYHHYAVSTTFPVELGAESAYLVMDHHTTHFEAEIPLDWGELG